MIFLVENCFHWLGFHIINRLLDNGYQVDGMDDLDTDKKEHLSMFVGRNELFRHITSRERNTDYDISIQVDECKLVLEKEHPITIKLPLIFGEWMPMNQKGLYVQNEFMRFDSKQFLTNAVYVKDVLESLQQLIDSSDLPRVLEVRSCYSRPMNHKKLENSIYIRNNRPIQERISIVK